MRGERAASHQLRTAGSWSEHSLARRDAVTGEACAARVWTRPYRRPRCTIQTVRKPMDRSQRSRESRASRPEEPPTGVRPVGRVPAFLEDALSPEGFLLPIPYDGSHTWVKRIPSAEGGVLLHAATAVVLGGLKV